MIKSGREKKSFSHKWVCERRDCAGVELWHRAAHAGEWLCGYLTGHEEKKRERKRKKPVQGKHRLDSQLD